MARRPPMPSGNDWNNDDDERDQRDHVSCRGFQKANGLVTGWAEMRCMRKWFPAAPETAPE